MFGDDVLPFDVVEVPFPRRNDFHTRTKKIKIVQFWDEAKSYITVRRLFCHEFELLSSDTPSSKLIMIFVQHLDSTGTVHTTTHTRAVQRSPCPRLTWMPCASQSPQVPKNPTATVHRSWDSLTLFSLSLSVYPSWILCKEKLQLSNQNAQRACGRGPQLLWTVAVTFLGGLQRLTRAQESILAWDMVTAELLLCVLCNVHGTRAIQVLHKYHDELAAGVHHADRSSNSWQNRRRTVMYDLASSQNWTILFFCFF